MYKTITCKNCGHVLTGKYCSRCGEKIFSEQDKSLSNLLQESFHFVTHFDGTFFHTLKTFFSQPGKMSSDYCFGIRKKYFKPISFFLMLVILYLLSPRFQGLNMKMETYSKKYYNFTWLSLPVINAKMKRHSVSYMELAQKYNDKSTKIAKGGLLLLIPLSAIVLMAFYFKRGKPFFDHIIIATEINSFYIFSHFLFFPFIAFIVSKIAPAYNYIFADDSSLWLVVIGIFALFILLALKNFYKEKWWLTIIKALLFLIIFSVGIKYVYGTLIFLLVMLFV